MSLYNTLNGNSYKVGDIRFTTIDNVNLDKEIILTQDRQFFDSSVAPLLYEKEGFQGASGILSLDNPVDDIISLESGEKLGNIIIEKNDNELYLLSTTDIGSNNTALKVYRILNRDFSNPIKIIEMQFVTNSLTAIPCFKGDDELHIVIGDNSNIRYYIYDTLNDVEVLQETIVTSGENPTSIRYIESKDEVVFTATIATNSMRIYSVTSDNNFILQAAQSIEPKRVNYNNSYVFRCDKVGTNNFYDNKLWFFAESNDLIFSFNVNTYKYTLEKDISSDITLSNISFSFCQVTENGTFYFITSQDSTNNKIELFTAKNGDLNNSNIIMQDIISFPTGSYLSLMDDNSAIIKLTQGSGTPDVLYITYDLNEIINPFSTLITLNSSRNVSYSVTKNNDKLYIAYSTTASASNDVRYVEFDITESDGVLIIPRSLSTDDLIVMTIRKEI